MTALPAIKPLPMPAKAAASLRSSAGPPGVSPLPPECRGSGYSFAAAGRDCCHCAEYGEYRDEWLEHPASLLAFHALVNHIHTCPACRAVAARFEPPSEELVERLVADPMMPMEGWKE